MATTHPTRIDDLHRGDTIIVNGTWCTFDHADPTRDGHRAVHTTAGTATIRDLPVLRVVEQGIPAPGAAPEARPAGTLVHFWSGVTLCSPAILVQRRHLRPGDRCQSSHGYTLVVTRVQGSTLEGTLHTEDGETRHETYAPNTHIPVFFDTPAERDALRARAGLRPGADSTFGFTDAEDAALGDLVHTVATQAAAAALNNDEGVRFLQAAGWSLPEIIAIVRA